MPYAVGPTLNINFGNKWERAVIVFGIIYIAIWATIGNKIPGIAGTRASISTTIGLFAVGIFIYFAIKYKKTKKRKRSEFKLDEK